MSDYYRIRFNVPVGAAVSQNELVVLDPSHPHMARFQVALKKQLSTQKEKLDQELKEANDSLRRFEQLDFGKISNKQNHKPIIN